jgi:hypothetical protein
MIEKGFGKAWNLLAERIKAVRPATWIVLLVLGQVSVRAARQIYASRAGHREEIATAIGSMGFVYGAPQPDSGGSRVIYLRTSEKGLAISATDVSSGQQQILHEWPGIDFMDMHDQVSPISPDDALFAYWFNASGEGPAGYLAFCRADSGQEVARVDALEYMNQMVWLTPSKLVWLGRKLWARDMGSGFHLHLDEKQTNGKWVERSPNKNSELTNATSLFAVSDDKFGWADNQGIHIANLASNDSATLFAPNGKQITACSYSKETGQFLVTCKDKDRFVLWRSASSGDAENDFSQLASDKSIQNAQWINGGKGFAYFNQSALVVKSDVADDQARHIQAEVDSFVPCPKSASLFLQGAVSNEPGAGIWRYDLSSETIDGVVCYSDYPRASVSHIEPLRGVARLGTNQTLAYYVYKPAGFDRHKKYPLVITDTPFMAHINQYSARGPSWAEGLADCGAYMVIVDRRTWFDGVENWAADVMKIYDRLIPDPTIDARNVYLCSASAETPYMSKLIEERPELWKGALYLSPTKLLDLSTLPLGGHLPRILVSFGTDEGNEDRIKQFQTNACAQDMAVELIEHTNTGHFLVSIRSVRERTQAMVNFVFNNP